MARAFLDAGIHVICDKPLTTNRADGEKLLTRLARAEALPFVLTHNYTGYPMVRAARAMVAAGRLGDLRVVQVEYAQDWLATAARGQPPAGGLAHRSAHAGPAGAWATSERTPSTSPSSSAGRRPAKSAPSCSNLRGGPAGRRQRAGAAALCRRRARHAVGQPGRLRRRERPAPAPLRQPRRAALAAGAAQRAVVHRARRAGAPPDPRHARPAGRRAEATRVRPAIPKDSSKPSRSCIATSPPTCDATSRGQPAGAPSIPGLADGVRSLAFIEAVLQSHQRESAWVDLH